MLLAGYFSSFAAKEGDSKDVSFNKLLIFIIALSCCFCGMVWSIMYYFVFGVGLTMILPLIFIVVVGGATIISHLIKDHKILIYAQLTCITWISALIQWSIGSMEYSGLVICWSFLGPLGALIFLSLREAIIWMLMFVVIVAISALYEPALLGSPNPVSQSVNNMFYVMNIGISLSVVFAASSWFVQTIKKEKLRSDILANKIQALFGQHVSKEIADQLINDETEGAKSDHFDATVMFADIRDFTVFADSRTPREVGNFQNTVFSEFINIIRAHRGVVLQALGDGVMAIFGAPIRNETHAQDGVNAGFGMLKKVKELSQSGGIPEMKLGIGLHSGRVIAGEVGNEIRKFYTLSGTNVIVAARIEQLNKTFSSQFLISSSVLDRIETNDIQIISLGNQKLKGISKEVGIYKLC